MPYLIYAEDFDDKSQEREHLRDLHRKHLSSMGDKLLASGALLDNDNQTIIGGISLIDVDDLSEAENFAFNDPYSQAGIRKKTLVIKWRKRWWEGTFLM